MPRENEVSELDELRKDVEKLSRSREWWIAIGAAVVAAFASGLAAYYSYQAQIAVADANKDVFRSRGAFDTYKEFGKLIVKGDDAERCRALLLISAIEPTTGMKFINDELAKHFECTEQPKFVEALKKSLGTQCRDLRPTRTTLGGLTKPTAIAKAKEICEGHRAIPDQFEGPWPDGTISFTSNQSVDGQEVWCNCLPGGK